MQQKKVEWSSFPRLESTHELEDYLSGREYGHGDYCHYTGLKKLDSILKNNAFWCGCVSGFNDKKDSEQFGDAVSQKRFYSLCFSTGENENLALWYLYSGLNGNGARIRLNKANVRKLIEESTYTLYSIKKNADGTEELDGCGLLLKNGENMKLTFRDIIYFKNAESKGTVDLKYNTMTNHNRISISDFEKFKNDNAGFYKGLIWYYEKETRLLIELIGEAADKVNNDSKKYVVVLNFGSTLYQKINVDFAPEVEDINSAIQDKKGIFDYVIKTSRAKPSKYQGTVKMNFCKKCDKGK